MSYNYKAITEQKEFTWTIENFESLSQPTGTSIKSKPFNCGGSEWNLSLFPNGHTTKETAHISLFLNHLNYPPGTTTVDTSYKFYTLNGQGVRLYEKGVDNTFTLAGDSGWGFPKFCARSMILGTSTNGYLIDNGKLQIGIELTIKIQTESIPISTLTKNIIKTKDQTDYSEFYNNEALSDVKIIDANNDGIRAHKIILVKNSTYFAGIFGNDFSNNLEGQVLAQKISPQALRDMLKFIYSGKKDHINGTNPELVQDLLEAGDIYGIEHLKELCEGLLKKSISNENTISYLEFAEKFRCTELKEVILRRIIRNKELILITSEWKEFTLRNYELAHQVVLRICNV